jgi:hypothetical protein
MRPLPVRGRDQCGGAAPAVEATQMTVADRRSKYSERARGKLKAANFIVGRISQMEI